MRAGLAGGFGHLVEQAQQHAAVVVRGVDQAVDLPRLLRGALAGGDQAAQGRALHADAGVTAGGEAEPLLERGLERAGRVRGADAVAGHRLVGVDLAVVRDEGDEIRRQDGACPRAHAGKGVLLFKSGLSVGDRGGCLRVRTIGRNRQSVAFADPPEVKPTWRDGPSRIASRARR